MDDALFVGGEAASVCEEGGDAFFVDDDEDPPVEDLLVGEV